MLNKTSAYIGLVIATAAGALLANSPANAQVDLVRGSHHHRHHGHHFRFHHRSHNRNWNGNHNRPRIFIRIYIYNKNNNRAIAVARPERGRFSDADRISRRRDPGGPGGGPGAGRAGDARAVRGDDARGTRGADTRDGRGIGASEGTTDRPAGRSDAYDRRAAARDDGGTRANTDRQNAPRDYQGATGAGSRGNDESFSDGTPTS